ncbi:MAG: hypothetical protein ACTSRS_21800 [Candidatus Helarchaeota archaeon]
MTLSIIEKETLDHDRGVIPTNSWIEEDLTILGLELGFCIIRSSQSALINLPLLCRSSHL